MQAKKRRGARFRGKVLPKTARSYGTPPQFLTILTTRQRKPVGFYHQDGTFKEVAGVRIELTLPQLMRLVSLPRLVPAI